MGSGHGPAVRAIAGNVGGGVGRKEWGEDGGEGQKGELDGGGGRGKAGSGGKKVWDGGKGDLGWGRGEKENVGKGSFGKSRDGKRGGLGWERGELGVRWGRGATGRGDGSWGEPGI